VRPRYGAAEWEAKEKVDADDRSMRGGLQTTLNGCWAAH
jgi:hypothetical protein